MIIQYGFIGFIQITIVSYDKTPGIFQTLYVLPLMFKL